MSRRESFTHQLLCPITRAAHLDNLNTCGEALLTDYGDSTFVHSFLEISARVQSEFTKLQSDTVGSELLERALLTNELLCLLSSISWKASVKMSHGENERRDHFLSSVLRSGPTASCHAIHNLQRLTKGASNRFKEFISECLALLLTNCNLPSALKSVVHAAFADVMNTVYDRIALEKMQICLSGHSIPIEPWRSSCPKDLESTLAVWGHIIAGKRIAAMHWTQELRKEIERWQKTTYTLLQEHNVSDRLFWY